MLSINHIYSHHSDHVLIFCRRGSVIVEYDVVFDDENTTSPVPSQADLLADLQDIWRNVGNYNDSSLNETFYELLGGYVDLDSITVQGKHDTQDDYMFPFKSNFCGVLFLTIELCGVFIDCWTKKPSKLICLGPTTKR